jgi:hypothetical protein
MRVQIKPCKSVRVTLRYHENKVARGRAWCLYSDNFLKDTDQLTLADKAYHFQRLVSLNDNITKPIVHVSLNFHPSQQLSDQQLQGIARDFMEKWGFKDQPWLVYRHADQPHPHIHLISTLIHKDGEAHLLAPRDYHHAKQLAKQLEKSWSLVPSKSLKSGQEQPVGPAQKIIYGQTPVYPAMRNIFANVIDHYRYTSLEELNAILRLYNVEAHRGKPESALYAHRGLLYRVLNEKGQPVGSAIKASLFQSKPTLKNLEKRFVQNQALRESHREHLTTAIDWAFYKKTPNLETLRMALNKEQIDTIFQRDSTGGLQNIWYIDHLRKTVFDGNRLGSSYSADGITNRCAYREPQRQEQTQKQNQQQKIRPRLDLF